MSDLIRAARERKEVLQRELEELDTFIRVAMKLSCGHEASQKNARRGDSLVAKTVALSRKKILAAGRPLPVAQLHNVLADEVEIGGKDPHATLSARLSNSHKFTSYRGLGWWPKDHPLPSLFEAVPDEEEASEASHSNSDASLEDPPSQKEDEHAAALAEPVN